MADYVATRASLPRWMALLVMLLGILLAHVVGPWAISLLTPRYGWDDGRPGIWNLLGLVPIAVGAAGLVWIMAVGFAQAPASVELSLSPRQLLTVGPYAFTRNPMYLAELGLWLGWTLAFGSAAVFSAFAIFLFVVTVIVVPREERGLEAQFGEAFRAYRAKSPRWFGTRQSSRVDE